MGVGLVSICLVFGLQQRFVAPSAITSATVVMQASRIAETDDEWMKIAETTSPGLPIPEKNLREAFPEPRWRWLNKGSDVFLIDSEITEFKTVSSIASSSAHLSDKILTGEPILLKDTSDAFREVFETIFRLAPSISGCNPAVRLGQKYDIVFSFRDKSVSMPYEFPNESLFQNKSHVDFMANNPYIVADKLEEVPKASFTESRALGTYTFGRRVSGYALERAEVGIGLYKDLFSQESAKARAVMESIIAKAERGAFAGAPRHGRLSEFPPELRDSLMRTAASEFERWGYASQEAALPHMGNVQVVITPRLTFETFVRRESEERSVRNVVRWPS